MHTRYGGRRDVNWWLRSACAFLIVTDLLGLALGLASIPGYVRRAGTLIVIPYQVGVNSGVSNETILGAAAARGTSSTCASIAASTTRSGYWPALRRSRAM